MGEVKRFRLDQIREAKCSILIAGDYGLNAMHVVQSFDGLKYPKLLGLSFPLYSFKQRMTLMDIYNYVKPSK